MTREKVDTKVEVRMDYIYRINLWHFWTISIYVKGLVQKIIFEVDTVTILINFL